MREFGACDPEGENSGKFVVGSAIDTEADAHAKMLMCLVDNKLLTPPKALVGSCLPHLSPLLIHSVQRF